MPDNTSIEETLDHLPGKLEPPKRYSNVIKEYPWSERRIKVAKQLLSEDIILAGKELLFYSFLFKRCMRADGSIGFQEALVRQVNDMVELLRRGGGTWGYVCTRAKCASIVVYNN